MSAIGPREWPRVVHPAATPVHGDADAGILQCRREGEAGEPAHLAGVEDVEAAMAGDRLCEGGNTEVGIHRVRQPPSQHLAAGPVHDGDEVEEASAWRM